MFSQASVILFTGGVYPSMHWDRQPPSPLDRHPPGQTPHWSDTPLVRHSSWSDIPPGQTPPQSDNPPSQTLPLWSDTPPGQTHTCADTPPGRHTPPRRPLQRMVRILLECILIAIVTEPWCKKTEVNEPMFFKTVTVVLWEYHYGPQTKFGEGNIFTSVCDSFCSQGRRVVKGGVW